MKKIVLTGASGLLGAALCDHWSSGIVGEVQVMRVGRASPGHAVDVTWDQLASTPSLLEGVDAVVHLAGESIAARWTRSTQERILQSRVATAQQLVHCLQQVRKPPSVFVSASAVGYYGNRGEEVLTERSAPGKGFLADVCQQWEASSLPLQYLGVRTAHVRLGTVLAKKGGALAKLVPLFRWGLGGRLGSGEQFFPWISLDDAAAIFNAVLWDESFSGPVNAVSPHPTTNAVFTQTLGKVLQRPTLLDVPACILRLMLGQMGEELLLSSARVLPEVLEHHRFSFAHPELEGALRAILI